MVILTHELNLVALFYFNRRSFGNAYRLLETFLGKNGIDNRLVKRDAIDVSYINHTISLGLQRQRTLHLNLELGCTSLIIIVGFNPYRNGCFTILQSGNLTGRIYNGYVGIARLIGNLRGGNG